MSDQSILIVAPRRNGLRGHHSIFPLAFRTSDKKTRIRALSTFVLRRKFNGDGDDLLQDEHFFTSRASVRLPKPREIISSVEIIARALANLPIRRGALSTLWKDSRAPWHNFPALGDNSPVLGIFLRALKSIPQVAKYLPTLWGVEMKARFLGLDRGAVDLRRAISAVGDNFICPAVE